MFPRESDYIVLVGTHAADNIQRNAENTSKIWLASTGDQTHIFYKLTPSILKQ